MENGRKLADAGNLDEARTVITQTITEIKNSVSKDDIFSQSLVADLELCLNDMQHKDDYYAKASKKMAMKEKMHKAERCTHDSPFYQTKDKMEMKMKAAPQYVPQPIGNSILPPPPGKIIKKLIVGNTHSDVVNPTDNRVHEWTFYVKFEDTLIDIGSIIDKITVELHSTFPDPIIEITKAPFEVTKKGWGLFNIAATIHFKDNQNKPDMKINHYLNFDTDNGKFTTYDITINAL